MASEEKGEGDQQTASPSSAVEWIEEQYRKVKTNTETYPYVWGSYIVVYGGFGLWMGYRWRKLRKTEDRVRVLQARLRELVQAEEDSFSSTSSAAAVSTTGKASSPASDKSTS